MTDILDQLRGLAQNPYPHGRAGQFGQTFLDRFASMLTQQAQANQLAQMEERKAAAQAGHGIVEIPSWFAEEVKAKRGIDLPSKVDYRIFQMFTPLFAPEKQVDPKTLEESLSLSVNLGKLVEPYRDVARIIASMNSAWEEYKKEGGDPSRSPALARTMVAQLEQIVSSNSRLRETALAQTAEGQSLLEKLQQQMRQIVEGGSKLSGRVLEDVYNTANTLARAAMREYDRIAEAYKPIVEQRNLYPSIVFGGPDPFDVLRNTPMPTYKTTPIAPVKPGTKVGGYTIEAVE